ncbi:nucleoside triphosphate pyrophosphohydrolase [Paraconexibacter sp.]|uniref:nucleoside triphosphate pyrophosphohydrolase n=1 Tax=Paraconexibacter sp. TaxID=2949640 RepID=UPI003562ABC5
MSSSSDIQEALIRLDALTRELREACPWDREQDARSIVPHTVEEAFELADAANAGDDRKMVDELGDVLFQVHFLSLLLEERGVASLADVAEHCRQKLIRRHPHVYPDPDSAIAGPEGTVDATTAGEVLANWDQIKQSEEGRAPGIFGEVPENLPGPLYARKVQRRTASTGFDFDGVPLHAVQSELEELAEAVECADGDYSTAGPARDALFHEVGDVLFAAVNVARKVKVDPELALRAAADRFRGRIEAAESVAAEAGEDWSSLSPERQLQHYAQARLRDED